MKKTAYDIELSLFLKKEVPDENFLIYESSDNFFDEIEKYYPTGFNGIDWQLHKPIFFEYVDTNSEDALIKISSFLLQIKKEFPVLYEENVVIFGDNLTSVACQMKFKVFSEFFDAFLSIPQHTYVWFVESHKCINYTFENELFFG